MQYFFIFHIQQKDYDALSIVFCGLTMQIASYLIGIRNPKIKRHFFKLNHSTQPSSEVKKAWILHPRLPHTIVQTLLVAWQR